LAPTPPLVDAKFSDEPVGLKKLIDCAFMMLGRRGDEGASEASQNGSFLAVFWRLLGPALLSSSGTK